MKRGLAIGIVLIIVMIGVISAENIILGSEFELKQDESAYITNSEGSHIISVSLLQLNSENVEARIISSEGNLIVKEELFFNIGETKEVYNVYVSLISLSSDSAIFKTSTTSNCISEGKLGQHALNLPCCEGLIKIDKPRFWSETDEFCYPHAGAYTCISCGDGFCGLGESFCNCPEDCEEGVIGQKVEDTCEMVGENGECIDTAIIEPEKDELINIPQENNIYYLCKGCKLDNKCYPLGYRKSGEYCSEDLEFIEQSEKEASCENNFECKSNVCVSGECVSEGLIKKILNWFKRLFGRE